MGEEKNSDPFLQKMKDLATTGSLWTARRRQLRKTAEILGLPDLQYARRPQLIAKIQKEIMNAKISVKGTKLEGEALNVGKEEIMNAQITMKEKKVEGEASNVGKRE